MRGGESRLWSTIIPYTPSMLGIVVSKLPFHAFKPRVASFLILSTQILHLLDKTLPDWAYARQAIGGK